MYIYAIRYRFIGMFTLKGSNGQHPACTCHNLPLAQGAQRATRTAGLLRNVRDTLGVLVGQC